MDLFLNAADNVMYSEPFAERVLSPGIISTVARRNLIAPPRREAHRNAGQAPGPALFLYDDCETQKPGTEPELSPFRRNRVDGKPNFAPFEDEVDDHACGRRTVGFSNRQNAG